jgi:DNA polymerase-3 subunit epsilon
MELNLKRPIAFFDLETTGLNTSHDRIVEMSVLKINVNGEEEQRVWLLNPEMPISAESTSVHGYTDEMVADKPTFREKAKEIALFIGNADLAGYNSNKFDVPMLVEEFLRCGQPFDLKCRRLIDVQNIFHKMEQRTLKAAYRFYCGKNLDHAHSADADTLATYEVLMAQLDRYHDAEYTAPDGSVSKPIVNDMQKLSLFTANNQWADLVGHIGYDKQHREIFNFGKHKGKTLDEVFKNEPAYYDWMMKADFPLSTKECITEVWKRRQAQKLQDLKLHFSPQQ